MFSITTIASSITIPTASEIASIVMLLAVKSSAFMTMKPPRSEIGIATTATTVVLTVRRNRYMITAVSRIPIRMSCWTPAIDSLIWVEPS